VNPRIRVVLGLLAVLLGAMPAPGQDVYGPPSVPAKAAPAAGSLEGVNPLEILAGAGDSLGSMGGSGGPGAPAGKGAPRSGLSSAMNIVVVLTVITLVPSIMLMTTCFVRVMVVLGLLRQALGTTQLPPTQVILALSLFITMLVMAPTMKRIHDEAVAPYNRGEIADYEDLWNRAKQPVRDFMFDQIDATGNWSSVYMVLNYRGVDTSDPSALTRAKVDMVSLIPAYMLSELKVSFLMGFRIYLPFLVIDMVIACLLISMSMMMLPPVMISMPFKLLLFIMVDGWTLVVGSLMTSFVTGADHAMKVAPAILGVPPG
jgi:flagellar biosynthetic protein FliP